MWGWEDHLNHPQCFFILHFPFFIGKRKFKVRFLYEISWCNFDRMHSMVFNSSSVLPVVCLGEWSQTNWFSAFNFEVVAVLVTVVAQLATSDGSICCICRLRTGSSVLMA